MIAVLLAFGILSVVVLSIYAVLTILHRPEKRTPSGQEERVWPHVSLLKPVKGVDDDIEKNLESFFALDYPHYEILFAVDSLTDDCVDVIEALKARHPRVPATIVITGHSDRENPKIHKLACLEGKSRGALYWITDANVRVEKDTLTRLVAAYLEQDSKIVFSPIRGTGSLTFASLMENTYLNFFSSGSMITAWRLFRRQILVGKSALVERQALRTFGGFGYLKDYLAEDFLLGEAFVNSGFRLSLGRAWVTNVCQRASTVSFFRRMARWATLRYHLKRHLYIMEILLNPVALGLLSLPFFGVRGLWIPAGAEALKIGLEYLNFVFVNTEDRAHWRWHAVFPAAVIAQDIILLGVYIYPFLSRRVRWRGGHISVGKMTLIRNPSNLDNPVYEGA
jgi:ceramide glucosyltransferase